MFEQIKSAPWELIYDVMSRGNPPLALQFLIINSIFFVIFLYRRIRGSRAQPVTGAIFTHGFVMMVNIAIMFQQQLLPFYKYNVLVFIEKLRNVVS